MSSKLAELAGANELRGKVCVTDLQGITHQYGDEAAACAAWDLKVGSLEHRRGAFFETTGPKRVAATTVVEAEAPTPPPVAEIPTTEPTEKKRSGRKRRS